MDKIYYNVNSDELEKILLSNYYFKIYYAKMLND